MNKVPTAEKFWKLFTQLKLEHQEIIRARMQELVEKRDTKENGASSKINDCILGERGWLYGQPLLLIKTYRIYYPLFYPLHT